MEPYDIVIVESLRREIELFNSQLFIISVVITVLAVVLYVVSHSERFASVALGIPVLLIAGLFAVARADLLMHRAGTYIEMIESQANGQRHGWEAFKASLVATKLLPLYDIGALAMWAYLLAWSERRAARLLSGPSKSRYMVCTGCGVLLGILALIYGAMA